MRKLKESSFEDIEDFEIDLSSIINNGEDMLSFQEMLDAILEQNGVDDMIEQDEEYFDKRYHYYKEHGYNNRNSPMSGCSYEADEAWMQATRDCINRELKMINDDMIYNFSWSGRINDFDEEYQELWNNCVKKIEKPDPDDGSSFFDRWDMSSARYGESKKVNRKRVQEKWRGPDITYEWELREHFKDLIEHAYMQSKGKLGRSEIEQAFQDAMDDILEEDAYAFRFYDDDED